MWAGLWVLEPLSRESVGSGFQKWGLPAGQQHQQTSPLHMWVRSRHSGPGGPGLSLRLLPHGAREVVMTA